MSLKIPPRLTTYFGNKKRFPLIGIVTISILSIIYIGLYLNSNSNTPAQNPSPSTISPSPSQIGKPATKVHYLYRLNPASGVNWVYWNNKFPYYVSQNSLYKLGNNNAQLQISPTARLITDLSQVQPIYKDAQKLYTFNLNNLTIAYAKYYSNGIYSYNLQYAALFTSNTKKIAVVNTQTDKNIFEKDLTYYPKKIFWSNDSTVFIVTSDKDLEYINLLNSSEVNFKISFPVDTLKISSDHENFSIQSQNNLLIYNIKNIDNIITYKPEVGNILSGFSWIDDNNLVIIETIKTEKNNHIDYLYQYNLRSQQKTLLRNSTPIPSNIDTQIPLAVSPGREILLVDNNGGLWLVSSNLYNQSQADYNKSHEGF